MKRTEWGMKRNSRPKKRTFDNEIEVKKKEKNVKKIKRNRKKKKKK